MSSGSSTVSRLFGQHDAEWSEMSLAAFLPFILCAQLTAPGQLQLLGTLIVGMNTVTFLNLTSDRLLSSLPAMAQHGLRPPQANAIATKLWVQDE